MTNVKKTDISLKTYVNKEMKLSSVNANIISLNIPSIHIHRNYNPPCLSVRGVKPRGGSRNFSG